MERGRLYALGEPRRPGLVGGGGAAPDGQSHADFSTTLVPDPLVLAALLERLGKLAPGDAPISLVEELVAGARRLLQRGSALIGASRRAIVDRRMTMRMPTHATGEVEPRRKPHRYLRPPEPLHFPESEEVPETNENLERRVALYFSLKQARGASATIGSDQFVYWDPTSTKKRLAPDVFVRLGQPHRPFRVWKIWLRGAPELGVEIISRADEGEPDWDEKLGRYRAAGIGEVVRFDPEDDAATLRIWDLVEGDLVERAADDPEFFRCEALELWWVVVQHEALGAMLRLAHDRAGRELLATPEELAVKAREESVKAHVETEKAREESVKAREGEARAQAENERLQAELAALRAQVAGTSGKARKRKR